MADKTRGKKQWWERPDPEDEAAPAPQVPAASSLTLTEEDVYLFREGTHYRVHERMGAHPDTASGVAGTRFAVWAPNAAEVTVIGDWNAWDKKADPLAPRAGSGLWEGFLPGVGKGMRYKYHVVSRHRGYR